MTNPILVEAWRAETLESFHRGVICIVDEHYKVLYSKGDIYQDCFPRSAMKYLQHIPLLESGAIEKFGISLKEIAIMCGSHNAESYHVETVNSILTKIGLDRYALQCGAHYPMLPKDFIPMYAQGAAPQDIHNNCSGKHAGFLALCVFNNWDIESYLSPEHPLQKLIKETCASMYEVDINTMHYAFDGCSAPIYNVNVYHQAIGYKNLICNEKYDARRQKACNLIIEAVSKYPEMVAGTDRYCTDMMKICQQEVIGKTGAEGIFCLGFKNKRWGACIKIDDGKMLPQYNVAQAIIESSKLFSKEQLMPLHKYLNDEIKNWNQKSTGKLMVNKIILEELANMNNE